MGPTIADMYFRKANVPTEPAVANIGFRRSTTATGPTFADMYVRKAKVPTEPTIAKTGLSPERAHHKTDVPA